MLKCFSCEKTLHRVPKVAIITEDGQSVYVGPDCARRITANGAKGYQPPGTGPRLFIRGERGRCGAEREEAAKRDSSAVARILNVCTFPVLCAWCLKLGRRKVLEYATVSDSHGICQPCADKALAEWRELDDRP